MNQIILSKNPETEFLQMLRQLGKLFILIVCVRVFAILIIIII